jgi:hypothetical protein
LPDGDGREFVTVAVDELQIDDGKVGGNQPVLKFVNGQSL